MISTDTNGNAAASTLGTISKLPLIALGGLLVGVAAWSFMIFLFNMRLQIEYGFRYALRGMVLVVCVVIGWLVLYVRTYAKGEKKAEIVD